MTTQALNDLLPADLSALHVDEGGAIRVGDSRISLDLVVELYENGMTPEDIVRAHDTLDLANVNLAIDYYLRHGTEVRAYLQRRETEAIALRAQIEAEAPRIRREELVARRGTREHADATAGK